MRKILNKIPLTAWTIIILLIVLLFAFCNDFTDSKNTSISIATNIITILGVFLIAIQINKQSKNSVITTEFVNQPNFKFLGGLSGPIENSTPGYCSVPDKKNYNHCTSLHWFEIKQLGVFPAQDVNITLIHNVEKSNISEQLKSRTKKFEMMYPNDIRQYKLPPYYIPISYFDRESNGKFYILLDYISVYSQIRYKRIYELNYSPKDSLAPTIKDWKDAIYFYDLTLINLKDSMTVSWSLLMKNLFNKFLIKTKIKNEISLNEWIIEL